MKISVKINVFNEEDNIAAVCESVSWADEIIIVDSDSTDRVVTLTKFIIENSKGTKTNMNSLIRKLLVIGFFGLMPMNASLLN